MIVDIFYRYFKNMPSVFIQISHALNLLNYHSILYTNSGLSPSSDEIVSLPRRGGSCQIS